MRLAERLPLRTVPADELLTRAVERLRLSGRGRAKVASRRAYDRRAGPEGAVEPEHVAEALAYRTPPDLAT